MDAAVDGAPTAARVSDILLVRKNQVFRGFKAIRYGAFRVKIFTVFLVAVEFKIFRSLNALDAVAGTFLAPADIAAFKWMCARFSEPFRARNAP